MHSNNLFTASLAAPATGSPIMDMRQTCVHGIYPAYPGKRDSLATVQAPVAHVTGLVAERAGTQQSLFNNDNIEQRDLTLTQLNNMASAIARPVVAFNLHTDTFFPKPDPMPTTTPDYPLDLSAALESRSAAAKSSYMASQWSSATHDESDTTDNESYTTDEESYTTDEEPYTTDEESCTADEGSYTTSLWPSMTSKDVYTTTVQPSWTSKESFRLSLVNDVVTSLQNAAGSASASVASLHSVVTGGPFDPPILSHALATESANLKTVLGELKQIHNETHVNEGASLVQHIPPTYVAISFAVAVGFAGLAFVL